jgi:hypothetical protein
MDNATILAELKIRNTIAAEDEAKIASYISQMVSKALAYCNLTELPDVMFYTIIEMVEQRMGVGMVSSVTRGDTSIKYKTADEVITGFRDELNRYRRIKV